MDAKTKEPLLQRLKKELEKRNVSVPKFQEQTGIPKDRVYKWLKRGTGKVDHEDAVLIENWLSENLDTFPHKHTKEKIEDIKLGEIDFNQPVIQVVLNLSYIGKKNADSMDRMAATNQRNTEIIAALVGAILPNSTIASQLTASRAGSQGGDEVPPVEGLLNQAGIDFLKQQLEAGKKTVKDK
jgi:hypothetical protein